MSLRYTGRFFLRAAQRIREQQASASKSMASFKSQAKQKQVRWFSSAAAAEGPAIEEKLMRRKAEKAENVMNLVCWGPK